MAVCKSLLITRETIRPQEKWADDLVIADDHFNLPQVLCGYVWVKMLILSPQGYNYMEDLEITIPWHGFCYIILAG